MKNLSTISHDAIRKNATNNSPSKVAFQFSKTKRFKDPNPECPQAFYGNKSSISNRKTSFGYGKKSDFTKTLTCSPAATKYSLKSEMDININRGKSFGISRDCSPDRSYLIPQLQKVPGPGNYKEKFETKSTISYTLRPKTDDNMTKKLTKWNNPGPNTYHQINLQPKSGRFVVSKYSDGKLAKINPKTPRFTTIKLTPGPCNYNEKDGLSDGAKYILSNYTAKGTRPFSHTARFGAKGLWPQSTTPGPGHYQQPSQFGSYGDAKYYQTLSTFKSSQM